MAAKANAAPRVWGLVAREFWRRFRRRLRAGPAYRWRYSGRTPERVLIAPPDLRLCDAQIAHEIYHGRFPLAGYLVETGGSSPFEMTVGKRAWLEALHGFGWLRHMREARTELAAANARTLVTDWINSSGSRISGIAWQPSVTSRRILSWLQHSPVVLEGADYAFYRGFLKSLALQVRYLRSAVVDMPDGEQRLHARITLAFAALSLPSSPNGLRIVSRNLAQELDRQILPDGGHISRNPQTVLELLAELLPLRHTYANQAETAPAALMGAIDRMLPALRFFRHQDGSLARFNGMGPTIPDRIAAVLRHDDTAGAPLLHAPHSGYERLSMGGTTVIADTGATPQIDVSAMAHAGCLSFELSSGRHLFIVNAGTDPYGPEDLLPLARATAAHSTATLNDTSSCRFNLSPTLRDLLGTPLVSGPRQVTSQRTDTSGAQGFVACHDGYVSRFGLYHERELRLSAQGDVFGGIDRFFRAGGAPARDNGRDHVTIRFHIHPDVSLGPRDHLTLTARDGEVWLFTCNDVEPDIEESIHFASLGGPRRSWQIVLACKASAMPAVEWRFVRISRPGALGS